MKFPMAVLMLAGVLAISVAPTAKAISFEDMERIDQQEQSELLERARQAARSWDFSAAQHYLGQARNKGYGPKDIKAVETLIAQSQSAKAADDERKRREEAERRQRELAAQQASQSASASGGGGDQRFVIVTVECTGGLYGCSAKNLSISGGPGNFSPSHNGAKSGGIHRGYSGELAGQYQYSVQIERRFCSGSFSISGQKQNVIIGLYDNCNVSYLSEI